MRNVFAVQTLYAHWSYYSGYHWFLPLLSKKYAVRHLRIPYGKKQFHEAPFFKKRMEAAVHASGMAWYSSNDLEIEVKLFLRSCFTSRSAIHFLDGEHGYCYLAELLQRFRPRQRDNVRIIVTYHQPPAVMPEIFKRYDHLRRVDGIVLVGSNQYDFFRRYAPADIISVIPHGVHSSFFSPPPGGRPFNPQRFTCLCVGYHLRDYEFLVRVAAKVQGFSHIRFRIISGSTEAATLGNLKNVTVESGLSDEKLLDAYRQAAVLTMPLTDTTANNVILEAMACGLPVLTTDVGAIRDYVDEASAMLFAPHDIDNFAEALVALSRNQGLCATMGLHARKQVEERFSLETTAARYAALYG